MQPIDLQFMPKVMMIPIKIGGLSTHEEWWFQLRQFAYCYDINVHISHAYWNDNKDQLNIVSPNELMIPKETVKDWLCLISCSIHMITVIFIGIAI